MSQFLINESAFPLRVKNYQNFSDSTIDINGFRTLAVH